MRREYTQESLREAIADHESAIDLLLKLEDDNEFFLILNELRRRLNWLEAEQIERHIREVGPTPSCASRAASSRMPGRAP